MPAHIEMTHRKSLHRRLGFRFILLAFCGTVLITTSAAILVAQEAPPASVEHGAGQASAPSARQATAPPEAPAPPAETPAAPQIPSPPKIHRDTQVTVGSSLTIKKGEVARDVVVFSGSLRVEGEVIGDAVAIGGSAWIDGQVTGDVTAVGGSVHLGPKAEVMGDVNAIGGSVHRDEGAKVLGQVNNVGVGPLVFRGGDHVIRTHPYRWRSNWVAEWSPFRHLMLLFWKILGIMVLMLFACLVLVLFPQRLERVEERLRREPWKAALVGLGAEILFAPLLLAVIVLLAVSIIGIPLLLLVPFLVLAFFLTAFFGFAASAHRVGRWTEERFSWHFGNPYLQMVVGIGLIVVISLCGRVIGLGGGVLTFFSVSLLIIGWLVQYLAWTVGLGAALMSRWGSPPRAEAGALPAPAAAPEAEQTPSGEAAHDEDLFVSAHEEEPASDEPREEPQEESEAEPGEADPEKPREEGE